MSVMAICLLLFFALYPRTLGDINAFDLPKEEFYGKADRVISIEMFEHMKNYELLMEKVSNWLKPEGKVRTSEYSETFLDLFQLLWRIFVGNEEDASHA